MSHYADHALQIPLVACHDCGLVHELPHLPNSAKAHCTRCGGVLRRQSVDGIIRVFALNLAALLRLIWDAGEHRNDDIADKIARAA